TPAAPDTNQNDGEGGDGQRQAEQVERAPIEEDVAQGLAERRTEPHSDRRPDRRGDSDRRYEDVVRNAHRPHNHRDDDPKPGDVPPENDGPPSPSIEPTGRLLQATLVELQHSAGAAMAQQRGAPAAREPVEVARSRDHHGDDA